MTHKEDKDYKAMKLKIHNIVENFIQDIQDVTSIDTIIGVSIINDSFLGVNSNAATAYIPLIISSFQTCFKNLESDDLKGIQEMINYLTIQDIENLPQHIFDTYQDIIKNDPTKKKEI